MAYYTNRTVNGSATGAPARNQGGASSGWSGSTGTVGTTGALLPGFQGNQGEAYVRTVQPNELVSNQLTGLLARDNPYIQQAEAAARRNANSRGLMDSSIGVGASRAAAIQAGLPIAQADAARYGAVDDQNLGYLNQMALQQQGDATSRYNAELGHDASTYGTTMGLASQRERLAFEGEQQGLDRTFNEYMAGRAQQYGQQNAALEAGLGLMSQGQQFNYHAGLQAMQNPYIMQNPEAFGGFMQWMQGDAPAYMQNLFNFAFGLGGGN